MRDKALPPQSEPFVEEVDAESKFTLFKTPGLTVIVLEQALDDVRLRQAVQLAARHKPHVLDLAAFAFPGSVAPRFEAQLASLGILVVDSHAESPRTRAIRFVRKFWEERQKGLAHVREFANAAAIETEDKERLQQEDTLPLPKAR